MYIKHTHTYIYIYINLTVPKFDLKSCGNYKSYRKRIEHIYYFYLPESYPVEKHVFQVFISVFSQMCVLPGSKWTWVVSPIPRCLYRKAVQYQSTASSPLPAPLLPPTTARITLRVCLLSPTAPTSAAWLDHNTRSTTEWVSSHG